jgi:hypothetical protein
MRLALEVSDNLIRRAPLLYLHSRVFPVVRPSIFVANNYLECEGTTTTTTTNNNNNDRLAAFIAGLSKESIDRQKKHEWRQGYTLATDEEIKLLFDADKKAGYPPWSLAHARRIMADNVWVFAPNHNSPYARADRYLPLEPDRPPFKVWAAFRDHWKP